MRGDDKAETPSEAEARKYLEAFLPLGAGTFSQRESRKAVDAYRAAVLREAEAEFDTACARLADAVNMREQADAEVAALRAAEAETVALVERLRDRIDILRTPYDEDSDDAIGVADAWLARRAK